MQSLENVLDKISTWLKGQKPFVVYSKPGETSVKALFQADQTLYTSDFTESGFIMAPFSGMQKILIPTSKSEILLSESINNKSTTEQLNQQNDDLIPESKYAFTELVRKAIATINLGTMSKVVLSRKIMINASGFDLSLGIKTLLETNPTAFRYCFYHPSAGLWIGATPECLLHNNGNKFHTVSLAGTQKYNGSENVEWQEKEKQEQQYVTDFIISSLTPVTPNLKVSAAFTQKAGNLLHIKTEIEGEIKDGSDIREIINILHPTPAVCGLPKDSAMQFIMENEGYDREYYSGYLGELNVADGKTETDIFVNLRCMQIKENKAQIFVGCGITKDSNPESEFIETVNKSMTMRKILIQ